MPNDLMPYGSSLHADLVAKVGIEKGPNIRIDYFQPYGSHENADLVAKVGGDQQVPMPPKSPRVRVKRLNARKR